FIELDCSNKTVYEINKNGEISRGQVDFCRRSASEPNMPLKLNGGFIPSGYWPLSASCDDLKKCCDSLAPLREYVMKKIALDIDKAKFGGKTAGKWAAYYGYGISYYAFDAIPFEFFSDEMAINEAFNRFGEEAIKYVQELTEKCKKKLGNKMNQSTLAEIL